MSALKFSGHYARWLSNSHLGTAAAKALAPALAAVLLLHTPVALAETPPKIYEPAEAIVLAAKPSLKGVSGQFSMVVAASDRTQGATFLNSTQDYRAPENVTFKLSPLVAKRLQERIGQPPETYLIGKRIIVNGRINRSPVYNVENGRATSVNRIQHIVNIEQFNQIVEVEGIPPSQPAGR